ncbi:MAG: SDR family oxidoreductase [Elusimicrobia bacterium]|nr:SDR family oxidoreductase [Elusimicrobiota bacterium]
MKTVLITGATGFLGSHLSKKLLEQGNKIIAVDNNYSGELRNIEELLPNKNFTFIDHDVIVPFDPGVKIDQIYNLACPASPVYYRAAAVKTVKTCVYGTVNALDLAKKYNAAVLQSSTSEVYGNPRVHPQKEDYWGNVNPIGARSCYDEGKRCAETLFFDYHRTYGLNIKVVRIFNTYGPNMRRDDGRVVSNFICQALEGRDLTVFGDGSQTRSFCYVDDLIDGLIKMMNTPPDFTGPVNLGNPGEISMLTLAEKIKAKINPSLKIINEPLPLDDPERRMPDITLAKERLNWQPTVSLDEGLEKTIAYFRKKR